jgi:phosphohistidine phosphatase
VKTLLLVRHAKSSWKEASLPDRDRPLNRRGNRDAPEMGRRLANLVGTVDLIVSSPATRAMATARIVSESIVYHADAILED